jgi:hypothetical protein
VILANDLDSYLNAEIDGAKMAAKWLGFVQSPDLAEFQALRVQTDPRTGQKISRSVSGWTISTSGIFRTKHLSS